MDTMCAIHMHNVRLHECLLKDGTAATKSLRCFLLNGGPTAFRRQRECTIQWSGEIVQQQHNTNACGWSNGNVFEDRTRT